MAVERWLLWVVVTLLLCHIGVQSDGAEVLQRCCPLISEEVSALYDCVLDTLVQPSRLVVDLAGDGSGKDTAAGSVKMDRVLYLTYVSANIRHYATFFLLLNAAYMQRNGKDFLVLTDADSCNLSTEDQRWNKIPCLDEALSTYAKDKEYVVFLDADLLFLDQEYHVEELIQQHPDTDILLAEDSLDVGNTGMLIVKNTAWSKSFLRQWWRWKDSRNTFCDQHVLNKLSFSLEANGNLDHIRTVNYKLMNSKWPAVENYEESDYIIHLLGELSETREALAKHLVQQTCQQVLLANDLPERIELQKSTLHQLKNVTVLQLISDSLKQCDGRQQLESCRRFVEFVQHYCSWLERSHFPGTLCTSYITNGLLHFNELLEKAARRQDYFAHDLELWEIKHDLQLFQLKQNKVNKQLTVYMRQLFESFDKFVAYSTQDESERNRFQHDFRANVFYEMATMLIEHQRFSDAIKFSMIGISELSAWLEGFDDNGMKEINVQYMIMKYIELSYYLSWSYLEQNQLSDALEWCDIGVNNLDRMRKDYYGEDRLLVTIAKKLYEKCSQVYARAGNQLKSQQFKEYEANSRYFCKL